MQRAFINISGIPTHIQTWGKWVEESLKDTKEIIILVSGNPGLPGFYTPFLTELYNNLNCEIPIWVIGQAGHDDPSAAALRQVPCLRGNEKLFDLDAQIAHKIDFIEHYIPSHVKIHLVSHSIGSWISLQMIKQRSDIKNQIKKCYFLFPTIERMVESPNGWFFTTVVLSLYNAFGFLINLFDRLPFFIKFLLISTYFWLASIPKVFLAVTIAYLRPAVMEKVVFLAKQEMDTVIDLDVDLIEENKNLIIFYYGRSDGWVPVKYYEELVRRVPGVEAILDTHNISHAFVLKSSAQMARILGSMIQKNRVN